MLKRLIDSRQMVNEKAVDKDLLTEVEHKAAHLITEINSLTGAGREENELKIYAQEIRCKAQAILELPALGRAATTVSKRNYKAAMKLILDNLDLVKNDLAKWVVLLGWTFTHNLGGVMGEEGAVERSRSWIDEWLLGRILASSMEDLGLSESESWDSIWVIKILTSHQKWYEIKSPKSKRAYRILETFLEDEDVQRFLQVNRHQGILWFNKEAYDQLLAWMMSIAAINVISDPDLEKSQKIELIASQFQVIRKLKKAESQSDYQIEKLLEAANK